MQVHTHKSSCAPPRGTPWVTLSTEGAKVDYWCFNRYNADLREGKPRQKTIKPRSGVGRRANHPTLKNSELGKPHEDKTLDISGRREETKSWITFQVTVLTITAY